jgi:hypothetical protein
MTLCRSSLVNPPSVRIMLTYYFHIIYCTFVKQIIHWRIPVSYCAMQIAGVQFQLKDMINCLAFRVYLL